MHLIFFLVAIAQLQGAGAQDILENLFALHESNMRGKGFDEHLKVTPGNEAFQTTRPSDAYNLDDLHHRPNFRSYYHDHAVVKGKLFCATYDNNEDRDVNTLNHNKNFDVKSIEVYDDENGYMFETNRNEKYFISWDPYQSSDGKGGRIYFLRVVVKHTGCVPLRRGCYAVTSFIVSFRQGYAHEIKFKKINLGSKSHDYECSAMQSFFSFWPFS